MASSKLSKSQKGLLVETDLLSNLPKNLKKRILTYLPIKEAGRTSILSSKWRYVWYSIPDINFGNARTRDFEKFVDAILLLHKRPIRKFNISIGFRSPEAFDRWIVKLSRNGIRELILGFLIVDDKENPSYMMHSKFFSCDELNYINLTNCAFRVPNEFSGFKSLHTLELNYLKISDGEIEKLISRCPLLKKLKLRYWSAPFSDVIALKIDAPNLLSLDISGTFKNLQLCAPKLRFLYLALEEGAFALALFKGAPHLQSLLINVRSELMLASKFSEGVHRKVDIFKHLQTVKIVYIYADTLFSFVKFVLDYAPQLETLIIEAQFEYQEIDESEAIILEQILLLGRASPNAQILFK